MGSSSINWRYMNLQTNQCDINIGRRGTRVDLFQVLVLARGWWSRRPRRPCFTSRSGQRSTEKELSRADVKRLRRQSKRERLASTVWLRHAQAGELGDLAGCESPRFRWNCQLLLPCSHQQTLTMVHDVIETCNIGIPYLGLGLGIRSRIRVNPKPNQGPDSYP